MNPSLLIIVAMVLMVAEIFVPSFGILGVIGLLGFVVGFYELLQTLDPTEREAVLYMVVPSFLLLLGILGAIGAVLYKSRRTLFKKSELAPVGEVAEASDDFNGREGMVRIDGALWSAELTDDKSVKRGDKLLVLARNGLKLTVQNVHKI